MPDETTRPKGEWSKRLEQLLSGTSGEQVHAAMSDVRSGLDASLDSLASKLDTQAERLLGAFAQRVGALQTALVREAEASAARAREADAELARMTATVADAMTELRSELVETRASFDQKLAENRVALERDLSHATQQHDVGLPSAAEIVSTLHDRLRDDLDAVLGASSARLEQKLESFGAAIESTAGKLRSEIETFGRSAEAHDARIASAADEQQAKLEQAIGRLDSAATEMRLIAEVRGELSALSGELARAVESLDTSRSGFGSAVDGLRTYLETTAADISSRMNTVEAAVDRSIGEGRKALGGVTEETRSMLDDVRAAIGSLAGRLDSIEPLREQIGTIAESINAQMVQRTAGVKSTITERTSRLEDRLRELPDIEGIAAGVEPLISGLRDASDARAQTLAREVETRVRAVTTALDEIRASLSEVARTTESRISEVQENLVASLQSLETERDRVFIETMNELLARLPKPDRATFGQRLRLLSRRRHKESQAIEAEPPEDIEPSLVAFDAGRPEPEPRQELVPIEPAPRVQSIPIETSPAPEVPASTEPARPAKPATKQKKSPAKRSPKPKKTRSETPKRQPRATKKQPVRQPEAIERAPSMKPPKSESIPPPEPPVSASVPSEKPTRRSRARPEKPPEPSPGGDQT
jgi:ABC-type transporter Mla subunit MlaD